MNFVKRMKLSKNELEEVMNSFDGYIWIAVDVRRGVISAGDGYLFDLKDDLLVKKSKQEDIYGIGVDLETGEIDYMATLNRRNPNTENCGELTDAQRFRIETLMRYFFEDLPPYKAERSRPRYSRAPVSASQAKI